MQEKSLKMNILNCVIEPWKLFFKGFFRFFMPFFILFILQGIGLFISLFPIFPTLVTYKEFASIEFVKFVAIGAQSIGFAPKSLILMLLLTIIFMIAGLAIFCYAFWEYLIYFASCAKICKRYFEDGTILPFKEVNPLIKARASTYIKMLLLVLLICAIPYFLTFIFSFAFFMDIFAAAIYTPLFSDAGFIILGILALFGFFATIYLTLSTALTTSIFALNEEYSATDCIKENFKLVNKNFFKTIIFMIILVPTFTIFGFLISFVPMHKFLLSVIVTPVMIFALTLFYEKIR